MRTIRNGFSGLAIIGGLIVLSGFIHAQVTTEQTQDSSSSVALPDSVVQIAADADGLSLVPPDQIPEVGTFWLVAGAGAPGPLPFLPLKYNPANTPIYSLGSPGQFLVDGTINTNSLSAADLDAEGNMVLELIAQIQGAQANAAEVQGRMMTMDDSFPSFPGDGGDDEGSNYYSGLMGVSMFDTNALWLEITNVANGLSYLNLHNGTNQVYAIWSTTNLVANWQVETEVWPTNGTVIPTLTPFTVWNLNRQNLFLWAEDWTGLDSDSDGVPDWWAWLYWGTQNLTDTNLDYSGNGFTFAEDYAYDVPPTVFTFSGLEVTNNYVNSSYVPAQLDVTGCPYYLAISADDTNYAADAVWNNYTSTNITIALGSTEGWHEVWFGLRGHADDPSAALWQWKRLKLDLTPPSLAIFSPSNVVSQPIIQVLGSSPEPLAGLSCDLTNAAGLFTNRMILVLDQYYDTNTFELTTNNFQIFDAELTNGVNTFTIRAVDLAGNTTVTNFSFTLVSDTTAPVITLGWPTDGAKVCSDTFTVDGWLDDPSATLTLSLTGTNGATNTFKGLVERDGRFWVENVPLTDGTNLLTLLAGDAWGNTMTTNISVVKGGLSLTINSIPGDQLNQMAVTVTGTVGDASYAVWVNGVPATVNANGIWSADNVPVTEGGTASFYATAYPPGEAPAIPQGGSGGGGAGGGSGGAGGSSANPPTPNAQNANANTDKGPGIKVLTYHNDLTSTTTPHEYSPKGLWYVDSHLNWKLASISTRAWTGTRENAGTDLTMTSTSTWPADDFPPTKLGTTISSFNGTWYNEPPPLVVQEHCEVKGKFPSGLMATIDYARSAQTTLQLFTGGKAVPKRNNLFAIRGSATRILSKLAQPPLPAGTPMEGIPSENITMGEVGQLDTNGAAWGVFPNGTTKDVTPKVVGVDYYVFGADFTKCVLTNVCYSPIPVNRDRTDLGVGEEVSLYFIPPVANTTITWNTTAGGLDTTTGSSVVFTAPSNAASATVIAKIKGADCSIDFNVLEPSGINATIRGSPDRYDPLPAVGAGMYMDVVLQPATVSFYRLEMEEPGEPTTGITGYYVNHPPPSHSGNGADVWHPVDYNNLTKGPPIDFFDHAYASVNNWPSGQWGSYTWPIHPLWRVAGDIAHTNALSGWTSQIHTLAADGTMTVEKLGHHVTRHINEYYGTAY
ncbi:MAG: hypothetical protein ABSA45_01385 [Verrucomicrobiota bacterium]